MSTVHKTDTETQGKIVENSKASAMKNRRKSLGVKDLNKESRLCVMTPQKNIDLDKSADSGNAQHIKILAQRRKSLGFLNVGDPKLGMESHSNTERSNFLIKDQMKRLVKSYLNRSGTKK